MSLLTWAGRFQARQRLRSSMWAVPMAFAVGAATLEELLIQAGRSYTPPESLQYSSGVATAVLAAIAGSMMTVTGIVFSVLTLTVQYAGAAVSPRVVRTFYRDRVVKGSLGIFVGTFTYALLLIPDTDRPGAGLAVAVAVLLALLSTGMFLVMVNHVGQGLRPASMVLRVNRATRRAIDQIHPHPAGTTASPAKPPDEATPITQVLRHEGEAGAVIAVNLKRVARHAARRSAEITLIPNVGDYVPPGAALFVINETGRPIRPRRLIGAVALSDERTIDQDPAFGLRILVDTAIKALSPGVNDPTTAVVALDQIHDLLRTLATRELDHDPTPNRGTAGSLAANTPSWDDYLDIALVEIVQYGATTFQVTRRLHALLDDLQEHAPPHRQPALAHHRQRLGQRIQSAHTDPADRDYATRPDNQGIGSASPSVAI